MADSQRSGLGFRSERMGAVGQGFPTPWEGGVLDLEMKQKTEQDTER